jgi:hypothetical protein
MTALREDEAAYIAAGQCGKAVAELIEFAREGEASSTCAFDDSDTCEMLADALRTALQIDLDRELRRSPNSERAQLQAEVVVILSRFLDGWA